MTGWGGVEYRGAVDGRWVREGVTESRTSGHAGYSEAKWDDAGDLERLAVQ